MECLQTFFLIMSYCTSKFIIFIYHMMHNELLLLINYIITYKKFEIWNYNFSIWSEYKNHFYKFVPPNGKLYIILWCLWLLHWSKSIISGIYRVPDIYPILWLNVCDMRNIHTYRVPEKCSTNVENRVYIT